MFHRNDAIYSGSWPSEVHQVPTKLLLKKGFKKQSVLHQIKNRYITNPQQCS